MIATKEKKIYGILPSAADMLITVLILASMTGIAYLCHHFQITNDSIVSLYTLGVFLTSVLTKSYSCGIISSFAGVLLFNFLFVEPLFSFYAKEIEYMFTIAIMLIVSMLTATLASKLKRHAKESAQSAYRTGILLETNQLLQKSNDDIEMLQVAAEQLKKLLDREVIFYIGEKEATVFEEEKYIYLSMQANQQVFGIVGILVEGKPLDHFEKSIIHSILGECALAIENNRNAKEKEAVAVLAKNEQLRANLLRSISHDLRTPLTSISGNADALITNGEKISAIERKQMLTDIYDNSIWLNNLVENLLSATRIEEGRMNIQMSAELVDEVIGEAVRHIGRKGKEHTITVEVDDEFMFAKMDSRLIVQVLINLIDNAIKYTQTGSNIQITAGKKDGMIYISVADNGKGIPDDGKPYIFDMFYTGKSKIADSRRSLGMGLALCKSIVTAHGGEIKIEDNVPQGSIFTFSLPKEEVKLSE